MKIHFPSNAMPTFDRIYIGHDLAKKLARYERDLPTQTSADFWFEKEDNIIARLMVQTGSTIKDIKAIPFLGDQLADMIEEGDLILVSINERQFWFENESRNFTITVDLSVPEFTYTPTLKLSKTDAMVPINEISAKTHHNFIDAVLSKASYTLPSDSVFRIRYPDSRLDPDLRDGSTYYVLSLNGHIEGLYKVVPFSDPIPVRVESDSVLVRCRKFVNERLAKTTNDIEWAALVEDSQRIREEISEAKAMKGEQIPTGLDQPDVSGQNGQDRPGGLVNETKDAYYVLHCKRVDSDVESWMVAKIRKDMDIQTGLEKSFGGKVYVVNAAEISKEAAAIITIGSIDIYELGTYYE